RILAIGLVPLVLLGLPLILIFVIVVLPMIMVLTMAAFSRPESIPVAVPAIQSSANTQFILGEPPDNLALEKVWAEGEFTAGPAYGPDHCIFFSDMGNRIRR